MHIGIYCENPNETSCGKYNFELFYLDMRGSQYKQEYLVEINFENNKLFSSIDLSKRQIELGKGDNI